MSIDAYDQIVSRFGDLTPIEQQQLIHELTNAIAHCGAPMKRRSILELQGLGKEIWQGVDAADYVRLERASWPG
jgi:hypothetical protein